LLVSFFETSKVITEEKEEEGLADSVVTLLVSYYVFCGARTQEHSSRPVAAVFLFTAKSYKLPQQPVMVMRYQGHW